MKKVDLGLAMILAMAFVFAGCGDDPASLWPGCDDIDFHYTVEKGAVAQKVLRMEEYLKKDGWTPVSRFFGENGDARLLFGYVNYRKGDVFFSLTFGLESAPVVSIRIAVTSDDDKSDRNRMEDAIRRIIGGEK